MFFLSRILSGWSFIILHPPPLTCYEPPVLNWAPPPASLSSISAPCRRSAACLPLLGCPLPNLFQRQEEKLVLSHESPFCPTVPGCQLLAAPQRAQLCLIASSCSRGSGPSDPESELLL